MSASSSTAQQATTSGTTAGAQSPSVAGSGTVSSTAGSTSPVLSGKDAQLLNTSGPIYQLASNAKLTITPPADNSAELAAVSALSKSLQAFGSSLADSQSAAGQTQQILAQLANSATAASQATAANTASGGQTDNNASVVKIVGYVAAAVAAVFILPLLFRRKPA